MTRTDDLERSLQAWFETEAVGPEPRTVLAAVLDTTRARAPRSAWLVRLRGGGISAQGTIADRTRLTPLPLLLVLGLLLALVMAAVAVVGTRPRTGPDVFTPTGSLIGARSQHTATQLADGRVLIIGGSDPLRGPSSSQDSVELWDPATGSFGVVQPLVHVRYGHTATLLPDGRVLAIGGSDPNTLNPVAAAELWDPATGSFATADSLIDPRIWHTATLLNDGRVLAVGGRNSATPELNSAETWDPADGTFRTAGSMRDYRLGHTATLLRDGRVLVIGGGYALGSVLASAELWDPATGTFSPAGSMRQSRIGHTATLLPDGRVLVIGGGSAQVGGISFDSAEIWDPATKHFSRAGSLTDAREDHTATLLPDGRVLVVGGTNRDGSRRVDLTEIWDPASDSFGPAGAPGDARSDHTATLLADGRVLVVGGRGTDGRSLASAELFR